MTPESVDLLAAALEIDEGERLRLYRDTVGKLTIGVGHNIEDKGISSATSAFILREDIYEVIEGLNLAIPWWMDLDDVRQRVLANMAFNLGVNGLLGFKRTLRAVREGRYADAADYMLQSKWARQVGKRAVRLSQEMRDGYAKP